MQGRQRATLIGFTAIALWSFLALLTVATSPVPPLQLNAMAFAIGGALGLLHLSASGFSTLKSVPLSVYALGTLGLFGYHFLYFSALRNAPAAEAGLIAYLWPLLIVLFSGLLPGEHLRRAHVLGALLAFAGAALIMANGERSTAGGHVPLGYGLALACAFIWSGYSLVSRRFGALPTGSVAIFCLLSAVLSTAAHLVLEPTIWPTTTTGWAAIVALGLGPVGLAFYAWDIGVKHGNIQLLGVASYAAPVLSTIWLVVASVARPSPMLGLAAALISGGALVAARPGRAKPENKN